jgi:hypothetical protein
METRHPVAQCLYLHRGLSVVMVESLGVGPQVLRAWAQINSSSA